MYSCSHSPNLSNFSILLLISESSLFSPQLQVKMQYIHLVFPVPPQIP